MKFSTVVNATHHAQLVKGKERALFDVMLAAINRLRRVSGDTVQVCDCVIAELPRTGDNIRMRITWTKHARA